MPPEGTPARCDRDLRPPFAPLAATACCLALALLRSFWAPSNFSDPALTTLLAAGLILGVATCWAWIADLRRQNVLLTRLGSLVVPGESFVVVDTSSSSAVSVLSAMYRSEGEHPIVFTIRAVGREARPPNPFHAPTPATLEDLSLGAARLGKALHEVGRGRTRGPSPWYLLRERERILRGANESLAHATGLERTVALSAEWLLDNAYVIQGHVENFRRDLPKSFFRDLRVVETGPHAGKARAYVLACELTDNTDARLDSENIQVFLQSFQTEAVLTMAEIWAVPQMLRLALIGHIAELTQRVERLQLESEAADFWANRLLTFARRAPDRLPAALAELTSEFPLPSANFAEELTSHLYDEEGALLSVRAWLESAFKAPLIEVLQREQRTAAAEQVSLANAITSLRLLSQLDWREIFEAVGCVDAILWGDPAGVYPHMDFATRDLYRHVVEETARRSGRSEEEVAHSVIELSTRRQSPKAANSLDESLASHVGYYLVDDGIELLRALYPHSRALRTMVIDTCRRHALPVYVCGIAVTSACLWAGCMEWMSARSASPGVLFALGGLLFLPTVEIGVQIVNYLITRLVPPRPLPKMRYADGLPDEVRTLVIVHTLLSEPDSIRDEIERLEIRYLANPDPNLRFALASDYVDSAQAHMPNDVEVLDVAERGIELLNRRYGAGHFLLFHRERVWSESERTWMGWERKRGKIEQLNRLLCGETIEEEAGLRVGELSDVDGVQFVITLDSDTQLPRDTAVRLVEAISHPLNRAKVAPDGQSLIRGYGIIQPRVSTSLPSATATRFSRLFTDPNGIDPYTHVVSDVYQDLAGQASYLGKGIYDVQALHAVLAGRFPSAHLLSHDLIEGEHVRTALASDIELLELFPEDYRVFCGRQHRWTRGDWQIADWILPTVPDGSPAGSGRVRNPLNGLSRWKILDNLRRSLTSVASTLLLVNGCLIAPVPVICALIVALIMLAPLTLQLSHRLTKPWKIDPMVYREPLVNLMRSVLLTALMPHQAFISMDAIIRVGCRRTVGRNLLEWQSFSASRAEASRSRDSARWIFLNMGWLPPFAVGACALLIAYHPRAALAVIPFALLWLVSPFVVLRLSSSERRSAAAELAPADKHMLRQVARQTWRFFDTFVDPDTHWLPPDNYQELLRVEVAQRTSPTNIGLWLLANLAARDFGYITDDDVVQRTSLTMQTLDRLERYQGHLLNWYDTQTLAPLGQPYVSMVDSGNLLGALWAFAQGVEETAGRPVIDQAAFHGVSDAVSLLRNVPGVDRRQQGLMGRKGLKGDPHGPAAAGVKGEADELDSWGVPLARIDRLLDRPPINLESTLKHLRSLGQAATQLTVELEKWSAAPQECRYWAGQVERQIAEWNALVDRYLAWAELLAGPLPEGLNTVATIGGEFHQWRRDALEQIPSLRQIARGEVAGISQLLALRSHPSTENSLPDVHPEADAWFEMLEQTWSGAREAASRQLDDRQALLQNVRTLEAGMGMEFLYDPHRRLFAIGYNVSERRLDRSYYDLLASEARLGSFVAVARGDVPTEHWWALGRPFGRANLQRPLLSWNGTMFEYLMPVLLTRSYTNSLLERACATAVACQRAYARQRGIPWGISEAAYSALDARQIYQYRAFGVPSLGLKRGLEDDLVVAPYATALALAVEPRAAVENLRRLSRLAQIGRPHLDRDGLRGIHGYYESIDYARHHGPHGERGVIVYAYMAHHQGMILAAIDNVLHGNVMQGRFHTDPRVRATESILFERVPIAPPPVKTYARESRAARLSPIAAVPAPGRLDTPDTPAPRTHLLSNGVYHVMVTNAGGGYSRWKDFDITRWRADTTRDSWGAFCYLRDLDTGRIWSTGYQPVCSHDLASHRFKAVFSADKAEFQRRDDGIDTVTEIVVCPEANAEIHRIALTNRTTRVRRIELTSYQELALAVHNADRTHPAFNKLFIQTDVLPDLESLLAWRRLRSPGEAQIWAFHTVVVEHPTDVPAQYETDRARFLGRDRSTSSPAALGNSDQQEPRHFMIGSPAGLSRKDARPFPIGTAANLRHQDPRIPVSESPLSGTTGYVLDPIFSLRRTITVEPGQHVHVTFITGAAETREEAVALAAHYHEPQGSLRSIDLAWTYAQLELRHLRIQPEQAQLFQQLASHVIYPHSHLRAPSSRLRKNVCGQSRLWAYGISGDLPIVLVTIADETEIDLVREALQAHTLWRVRGLKADLVILNEEATTYEQPLQTELARLVAANTAYTGTDQPGGVFLRPAASIPQEDLTLLLTVARVVLIAARGPLSQQMSVPSTILRQPAERVPSNIPEMPSAPLPFLELPYFNGLGGFTQDGREYAIYLGPAETTPAPWVNIMANPQFGALVSESGSGFCWFGNSQTNRLTSWSNDPVSDAPSDAIYIHDTDTDVVWSPTPLPIRERDAYRARHGQGYTLFEHNSHGIEQELLTFVPVDKTGGDPVRVQRLQLRNRSKNARTLSVAFYAEWVLGSDREETQMHVTTTWDLESEAIFARNPYNPDYPERVAFAACSPVASSYTGDRTEFIGRNAGPESPAALKREGLSGRTGAGYDPCAVLQVDIRIEPGEEQALIFLLGQAADTGAARELIRRYSTVRSVAGALEATKSWWDGLLGTVQVKTPDLAVDLLLNRWLLYQTLSCRIWARSAFYQSGGAYGFRDQLQDVMALAYTSPQTVRDQLLRAASRQFPEGDVQHWWHPPRGAGVRTRISDDLLWLPLVTAHYVRLSEDMLILDEQVPFLDGRLLGAEEMEAYFTPDEGAETATLLEHCRRSIDRAIKPSAFGPHGLPLMGGGDWNDGMNLVGSGGKGESVWLAWFLVHVLNDFADILQMREMRGQKTTTVDAGSEQMESAEHYRGRARDLAGKVDEVAWDGEWYLRAFFDDGTPLGSSASPQDKIDSLPQSWAVLCGSAPAERAEAAMRSVQEHLVKAQEKMVLLFEPPFEQHVPSPGYIQGYPPGVRENGGQYTHGSLWVPMAFARLGRGKQAVELLRMMNPVEHARTPEDVQRYRVEPYMVAADIYAMPGQVGRGGWTGYTGSSGWMYRIWLEEVLGFKLRGDRLTIEPAIHPDWPGYEITYRYRSATYHVRVDNPDHAERGVQWIELDGARLDPQVVSLSDDGNTHEVLVRMGSA